MESNLLKKFLNFELSPEEEANFKKTAAYKKHQRTLELLEGSKTLPFNEQAVFTAINSGKSAGAKSIPLYKKWLPLSLAASILLCFSLFYFYTNKPANFHTAVGENITINLPDASKVLLNSKSQISYQKNWEASRDLKLNGEAYFEVAKGKKFSVETALGIVSVLGTKFNVKQRNQLFEVQCFEGSVAVDYANKKIILKANEVFSSKTISKQTTVDIKPHWIAKKSVFNAAHLNEVLADMGYYFEVTFVVDKTIDKSELQYTGSYQHTDDLINILEVLSRSLDLSYTIKDKLVYLTVKE